MATTRKSSFVGKIAADIAEKAVRDAVRAITKKNKESAAVPTADPSSPQETYDAIEYAYAFFNCDADKTDSSMNIRFNEDVYWDSATGREALFHKIEEELSAGHITVSDMDAVREAILAGDPAKASELLQYGHIERLHVS